ncbi:MAG: RagB/SusD family nutrient uptake outer membrane protein [Ferruginibacter sp.]
MKKIFVFVSMGLLIMLASCKKDYLETKPSNGISREEFLSKVSAIYSALDGANKEQFAYGIGVDPGVTRHDAFGQKGFDLAQDLMGNDMVVHSQGYGWFNTDYNYTESGNANANRQSDFMWFMYYDLIKQAHILLSVVDAIPDATTVQKETIKGQLYGIRAYAYFYLINYYQQTYKGNETKAGVPVYTEEASVGKPRGTVEEVYTQIIGDLTLAETLLTGKARAAKSNIDVSVVQGIRARVALIMEDWATAETYANKARQGYTLMVGTEYSDPGAFSTLANPEWMWGSLIPSDQATIYASFFSHIDISTGGYAALGGQKKITKALYDLIPAGDVRKTVFTAPGTGTAGNPDYNQVKHTVPVPGNWAADYLYMRAAEMYLIEAEALGRQSQDASARTVLEELIQTRDPLYSAASFSGSALVDEILLQRRIELWGEGFSLMDIKRLNQGLNRPTGAGNHGAPNFNPGPLTTGAMDPRFLFRIPKRELDNNENMTPADQNP